MTEKPIDQTRAKIDYEGRRPSNRKTIAHQTPPAWTVPLNKTHPPTPEKL